MKQGARRVAEADHGERPVARGEVRLDGLPGRADTLGEREVFEGELVGGGDNDVAAVRELGEKRVVEKVRRGTEEGRSEEMDDGLRFFGWVKNVIRRRGFGERATERGQKRRDGCVECVEGIVDCVAELVVPPLKRVLRTIRGC